MLNNNRHLVVSLKPVSSSSVYNPRHDLQRSWADRFGSSYVRQSSYSALDRFSLQNSMDEYSMSHDVPNPGEFILL